MERRHPGLYFMISDGKRYKLIDYEKNQDISDDGKERKTWDCIGKNKPRK